MTQNSVRGGLTLERRFLLCQPEQIENTMRLLSFLNHWAKSRDLLLYRDRQGLYEVKAAILETAYCQNLISSTGYISGLPNFLDTLCELNFAAEITNDIFKENWEFEEEIASFLPPPEMQSYKCPRCQFFTNNLSDRIKHWNCQHSQTQTALKSSVVSWILFGNPNKEKLFVSVGVPEPNAELPVKLSKSQRRKKQKLEKQGLTYTAPTKPAWTWQLIKDFVGDNKSLMQHIEAEILAEQQASFEKKCRKWERKREKTKHIRQKEKAKLAFNLNISVEKLEKLMLAENEEKLITIIASRIQAIIDEAIQKRQPLNTDALEALCLDPQELINYDGIYRFVPSWKDLNDSDSRKLDPEGYSLITFEYHSAQSHFTFNLPLRTAEKFLASEELEQLRKTHSEKREISEFYGREITEAEALEFPIDLILKELGVSIASVCPEGLVNKQEYLKQKNSWHFNSWDYEDAFDEDFDEQDF